jgi:hypothetical protein
MLQALKGIGAFGILLAAFALGFTMGSNFYSSSNQNLQIDLRHAQDDLRTAQENATKARQELEAAKTSVLVSAASPSPKPSTLAVDSTQETANITEGRSKDLFHGALSISVIALSYEGGRYTVDATIGVPGLPNVPIKHADVGYVTQIRSKDTYEVRVVSLDFASATFAVTKLPSSSDHQ